MTIKENIQEVKIDGIHTRVKVNVGELVLGHDDDTFTLILHTDKDVVHLLCYHFKKLGNINRYARCYGIKFCY